MESKESKHSNERKIIIILIGIVVALYVALFFYTKPTRDVKKYLEKEQEKVVTLDDGLINKLAVTTKSGEYSASYRNLITEILKTLNYEVVSVKKIKDSKPLKMEAVITLKNKDNDELINSFFKSIVEKSSQEILDGKNVDKEALFNVGMDYTIENYKSNFANLEDISNTLVLTFSKNEDKVWEIDDKETYYNALLGGMFNKIINFNEEELSELVITNFFSQLNNITENQILTILGAGNEVKDNASLKLEVKFFNEMNFEIVSKIKTNEGTKFTIDLDVIDSELFYIYVVERYVEYFKEANDNKQTPTETESNQKLQELFERSFEMNKDRTVRKRLYLVVTDDLEILNLKGFFNAILYDLVVQSQKSSEDIKSKIMRIYG